MGPFTRRNLIDLLDAAAARPEHSWVSGRVTGRSERVVLPGLAVARHMFAVMPVAYEPAGIAWDAPYFDSATPWECVFSDVLLHSDAGIACHGDTAVADTLLQTDAMLNGYEDRADGLHLQTRPVEAIDGTCLSLLVGGHRNYYHWTLDCLARLAGAGEDTLAGVRRVLVPAPRAEFHRAGLAYCGLEESHEVVPVAPDATLRVERVIAPWSVTGYHQPHPCIVPFFARMRERAPVRDETWPRLVYIDRRGGDQRPLANEDAVVAALVARGFVPVRLESHPLADQIAIFAHAAVIVAPHGAGLANLVFARPGTIVLELLMDGWVNWCFRHLSVLFGLHYDCVLGRQARGDGWVHARPWAISVVHVLAALDHALARAPA